MKLFVLSRYTLWVNISISNNCDSHILLNVRSECKMCVLALTAVQFRPGCPAASQIRNLSHFADNDMLILMVVFEEPAILNEA